jgi:hypothetical protein
MLKVEGVVTYSGSKPDKNGKPYGMVNIEGLFTFAAADNLPGRGALIEAQVQANQSGEGESRRTSYNLLSWQPVNGNGNGHS